MATPRGHRLDAASDSVSSACRELVRGRFAALFPDGRMPVTESAVARFAKRDWVGCALAAGEGRSADQPLDSLPEPWLPPRRKLFAASYLNALVPDGSPLTEEAVERTARQQGWVLRELEARDCALLDEVGSANAERERSSAFISQTRSRPEDGYGNWYACLLPRDLPVSEAARVVEMAQWHPGDARAQETACKVISRVALQPLHLDQGYANSARIRLASGEGLAVVLAAMRDHSARASLQCCACEALSHVTQTAAAARAAETMGAVKALEAAMKRFPSDAVLQWSACWALANIARHREKGPLGDLREVVGAVAMAMAQHPNKCGVQGQACALLWQLATEESALIATRPGMKGLVEHAKQAGTKEAAWLLECIQWRSEEAAQLTHAHDGRRRWGGP